MSIKQTFPVAKLTEIPSTRSRTVRLGLPLRGIASFPYRCYATLQLHLFTYVSSITYEHSSSESLASFSVHHLNQSNTNMVLYSPGKTPHGLPRDLHKVSGLREYQKSWDVTLTTQECVVPRPIGSISTTSLSGKDNLAPYRSVHLVPTGYRRCHILKSKQSVQQLDIRPSIRDVLRQPNGYWRPQGYHKER
jgi:hypothetical protein